MKGDGVISSRNLRVVVCMVLVTAACASAACWWDIDFDDDGGITYSDFFLFADHFGSSEGSETWDPRFDLADDGKVDFQDFFVFADTWPRQSWVFQEGVCGDDY